MGLMRITFIGLLFLSNSSAFSANISPVEFNGALASYKTSTDFIEIAPADLNGISYNKFKEFDLAGINLKILNISTSNQADIIVIEAPNINLDASVHLIGNRAEILFLTSTTNATINCNGCSFDGFTRITLASAKLEREYNPTSLTLGVLNSSAEGNVRLNNLDAPNALILDVIANNVSVDGLINLNQMVNKEILGGVSANKNGQYVLGGGSINFNIGALNWDYDTRKIIKNLTSIAPTPGITTLEGEIQSVEVKIISTKHLNMKTKIKSIVDIIASASYRGDILIPSNNVAITTLPNSVSSGPNYFESGKTNISIYSDIKSNGNVSINAIGNIYNEAEITANNIALSGVMSVNRGVVKSNNLTTLWGGKLVSNEFGGVISANTIFLESNSLVRNGSRTPYISNHISLKNRIVDHKPLLNPSSIRNGMYYITDHTVTDKTKPATTSAHIYAEKIIIKTAGFENINPYWVDVSYVNEFDLTPSATIRRDIVNGVSINAEKKLMIEASEYVYNSSAILRMGSEEGLLSIKGGILNNDRYRQMNLLSKSYKEERKILATGIVNVYGKTPTKTTELYTRSNVFAPPGRIYSAGDFFAGPYFLNTPSTVINNLGFFEVGRDATILSTTIKQKGLEHHRIAHVTEAEVENASTGGSTIGLGGCIGCSTTPVMEETGRVVEENIVLNSIELDSFFSIGGKLHASKSAFSDKNSSAFMEYLAQATEHRVKKVLGTDIITAAPFECNGGFFCLPYASAVHDISINTDDILSSLDNGNIVNLDVDVSKTTKPFIYGRVVTNTETVLNQSWSLFETLHVYYEAIKQSILDAIQSLKNQFGWWD
jgi:hypothetical protein